MSAQIGINFTSHQDAIDFLSRVGDALLSDTFNQTNDNDKRIIFGLKQKILEQEPPIIQLFPDGSMMAKNADGKWREIIRE